MINQVILFFKKIFEGPLPISIFRILGYNKPYRTAIVRVLPVIFKKFRPHYHSVIYESTQLALKLNLRKISLVEFGVAGGHGLLSIEKYCKKLSKKYSIEYEIFGFDFGDSLGLKKTKDPKDLPYYWNEGQFKMNLEKLKKKIKISKLILGDVSTTVKTFTEKFRPAPIGAIFFDLDYYTSTMDALEIFKCSDEFMLPRVICYFDDLQPNVNKFNGELAAINEFNKNNDQMKIAKDYGSALNYYYGPWEEEVFILHRFNHKDYQIKSKDTIYTTNL